MRKLEHNGPFQCKRAWRGATGYMLAWSLLLALLLAACGQNPPTASRGSTTPSPTLTARSLPVDSVLFQSDWSRGSVGWQASPHWQTEKGYLQTGNYGDFSLTLPYQPSIANYAVEYQVQVVSVPKPGGYFTFSADFVGSSDGYIANIFGLLPAGPRTSGLAPTIMSTIDPIGHMDSSVQEHDFDPGTTWKTYHVEVRGGRVVFMVNGIRHSQAISNTSEHLSRGPLRLQCGGAVLRVGTIRVLTV